MSDTSILLWPELVKLAQRAAREFGIKPRFTIEPLTHPRSHKFGTCDRISANSYRIELRVQQLRRRHPLSRRVILDTLAHEMAHLVCWEHGREHRAKTRELFQWMAGQCR